MVIQNKNKILIAGEFSFPNGSAAAARMRNLAEGLRDNNAVVHILPIFNTPTPYDTGKDIQVECIKKQTPKAQNEKLSGKLGWFLSMQKTKSKLVKLALKFIKHGEYTGLIGYGRSSSLLSPLAEQCREMNIPSFIDVVELRDQFSGLGGKLNPIYWDWKKGEKVLPKQFWCTIGITNCLSDYYLKNGAKKSLVIPSIENWEILPDLSPPLSQTFEILTVSSLIPRDDPNQILKIIESLDNSKINFKVKLVGRFFETHQAKRWIHIIRTHPVFKKRIELLGRVTDVELSALKKGAHALLLTRRDEITERFSFPTRLVEFLQTGRPVIAAAVGEIPFYLTHNTNAILFDPNHPASATQPIIELASHDSHANQIGRAGFEIGVKHFDRKKHCKHLLTKIDDFYRRR